MISVRRRTNIIAGLVVFAIALFLFLRSMDVVDDGLYDLFLRSWPAILILIGLSVLIGARLPFGKVFALIATIAIVAGVGAFAFSSRVDQQRDEYQETIAQPIDGNINLLRVRVQTLATDVELVRLLDTDSRVQGQFVGSEESVVSIVYAEDDRTSSDLITATLSVIEEPQSAFPKLESIGRGTLRLEIPVSIPLDVEFIGEDGTVILNMSDLALERLNVDLGDGDAIIALPEYDPVGSSDDDLLGTLAVRNGDITLIVPESVDGRFQLQRGNSGLSPEFDASVFNYLRDDILEARAIESADYVVNYTVVAPRGLIRVQPPATE